MIHRQQHHATRSRSRSSSLSRATSPRRSAYPRSRSAEPPPGMTSTSMPFDISLSSRTMRDKRRRSTASLDDEHTRIRGSAEDEGPSKRRRLSNDARALTPSFLADPYRRDQFQEFEEGSSRVGFRASSFEEFDDTIDVDALTETASPPPQSLRYTDASFLSQNSFIETEHRPSIPEAQVEPVSTTPKVQNSSPYNCPICFSPPAYPTLTPCGHVCCGDCLFAAVKNLTAHNVYNRNVCSHTNHCAGIGPC